MTLAPLSSPLKNKQTNPFPMPPKEKKTPLEGKFEG